MVTFSKPDNKKRELCGGQKYNTFLTGSQPKVTHFKNYNGDSEFAINVMKTSNQNDILGCASTLTFI